MACNFFPRTIPADKSIGAEDSLGAVFATDHSLISVRVGRDRGVVIVDTDLEIADLFAIHFIVGAVLHISQHRFFRGPRSTTEALSA
jgi:hypothetical protein